MNRDVMPLVFLWIVFFFSKILQVIRHHEANELRLKTLWEQHEDQLNKELEHNLELRNIG